jgi:hypothetical protein
MDSDKKVPKLLGAASLFVFVASPASTLLFSSIAGSGRHLSGTRKRAVGAL